MIPRSWRLKLAMKMAPHGLWRPNAFNHARMGLAFWLSRP